MAHSSFTPPYHAEPRTPPLRSTRRRWKGGWRGDSVSSSSCSSLHTATMSSSVNSSPVALAKIVDENRPAECSSAGWLERNDTNFPSSVFLPPSAGRKLGHMLSLIRQEDVEFKHYPDYTQIHLPSKKRVPCVMLPVKARRLRSLIALAHHLDEEDRWRRVVPASLLPESLQASIPIHTVERNISPVSSSA
ncbi:unnamed protein product [Calypogeia fissa]